MTRVTPEQCLKLPAMAKPALGRATPETVYAAYLAAIGARDYETIVRLTTTTFSGSLMRLKDERDFAVLFDLWCDSYPCNVHIDSCSVAGARAVLDVEMIGGGESAYASVTLIQSQGCWRVDQEQFYRRKALNATGGVTGYPHGAPGKWLEFATLRGACISANASRRP